MIEPVAHYDEASLGGIMRSEFRVNQDSTQRRAEPISGPARYRRILEEGALACEVQIVQTAEQFAAFQDFLADTLKGGSQWFTIDLYVGVVPKTLTAHLVAQVSYRIIGQGLRYAITRAQLECFEKTPLAYEHAAPIFIDAGTPASPSPSADRIDAGSPAIPSPNADRIWGGDAVGQEPAP